MNLDYAPIWVVFLATILMVMGAMEVGLKFGLRNRRLDNKDESSAATIAGAMLGLLAFILAFTFGIVTNRLDYRKELVREEVNAIETAYLRSDFMSEPDRGKTKQLSRDYLDIRIAVVEARDLGQMEKAMADSKRIQKRLWDMAVVNAFKDMNSDVAALYVDALNKVIEIHALRLIVGFQTRIPFGIWMVLYVDLMLSMIVVGYHSAVSGATRRSWTTPILAFAFSLVIVMITSLDRPQSGFIRVSQRPLMDLRVSMNE